MDEDQMKKLRPRRHRDDEGWDEFEIVSNGARLHLRIIPRFKTSALSGDEWRVSASLEVFLGNDRLFERGFNNLRSALTYGPNFFWAHAASLLPLGISALTVSTKGIVRMTRTYPRFLDAAFGMAWDACRASEGDREIDWYDVKDEEMRGLCLQPGCRERPVNFYRLKRLRESRQSAETYAPKPYEAQHVWYCARHTERGDSCFEDQDKNLELVHGAGVPRRHAADESPAVLAGVIDIGAIDLGGPEGQGSP